MSLLQEHSGKALVITLVLLILSVGNCLRPSQTERKVREVLDAFDADLCRQVQEVARSLDKGSSVALIVIDGAFDSERADRRYARITDTLTDAGLQVAGIENMAAELGNDWISMTVAFPYEDYLRVGRQYPDADAVISLYGAPYGEGLLDPSAAEGLPPLLLTRVEAWNATLQSMLDNGRIKSAVVLRREPAAEGIDPASFEGKYEVLTGKSR